MKWQRQAGEYGDDSSGYTDDAIVHRGVLDRGVSFIGKPYPPEGLARKVREVLDKA